MSKETKETVSEETVESKETVGEETVKETVEISPRTGKPIEKKYAPKNKRKPRGGNNWLKPENQLEGLEEGENNKYLQVQMELFNLPDIDLDSVEEVQSRLNEYFALYAKYDMKPTVAGMAIALGMNRRTLIAIVNDYPTGGAGYKSALPHSVALSIKKAYNLLENLWENYMTAGKLNPVTGIFLAKNNYGYQDKTEYVLTPNAKQEEEYSADEIRERYIAADQQKRLSTSDFDTDETSD